jgi:hypothetical protein
MGEFFAKSYILFQHSFLFFFSHVPGISYPNLVLVRWWLGRFSPNNNAALCSSQHSSSNRGSASSYNLELYKVEKDFQLQRGSLDDSHPAPPCIWSNIPKIAVPLPPNDLDF